MYINCIQYTTETLPTIMEKIKSKSLLKHSQNQEIRTVLLLVSLFTTGKDHKWLFVQFFV